MTTTEYLQKIQNRFLSCEEVKNAKEVNTNPRYKHKKFYQTQFTAGDTEQFDSFRLKTNGDEPNKKISLNDNIYNKYVPENVDWEKYKNLDSKSVDNTFNYLFYKFKKGIFVKIQDNELKVFLPFSNVNFINEWSNNIKTPPGFRSVTDHIFDLNIKQGYKVDRDRINSLPHKWYGNNCLIRTEYPTGEGDSGIPNIMDMLKTLCKERTVPDIEFFINRRDFPLITKDGTEPYYHMYDGFVELKSHNYKTYSPILSMVTTNNNSDIPMPTFEDWARVVSETDNEFFREPCSSYREAFNIPWEEKKNAAVWRGASTGCGTTVETNPRLKVSYLSVLHPDKINAGIVKWNNRPRKQANNPYLSTIENLKGVRTSKHMEYNGVVIPQVDRMSPMEQSSYKYLIHVDGHVSAFRLSYELKMGCVLLLADSQYRMWFRTLLKPYEHYVPVKQDLSDLVEKIEWCRNNDDKCKIIADNARKFYYQYLEKNGVLDYMQNLLVKLRTNTGTYFYPPNPVQDIVLNEKKEILEQWGKPTEVECSYNTDPRMKFRCFGLFEAVRWMMLDNNWQRFSTKEQGMTLSPSSTTTITNYNIFGTSMVLKESVGDKIKENVNEAFIASIATNELLKYIPNFRYIFKIEQDKMWLENVQGITLADFIQHHKQNVFQNILRVMSQVLLAIHVSQQRNGFIHRDLTPWNIILQYPNVSLTFNYPTGFNEYYECSVRPGDFIPILIDYGKSSVCFNGVRYDPEDTFDFSHDVIFFICRTFYELISKRERELTTSDKNAIVNIFNSLNLVATPFPGFELVKKWLKDNHTYDILSNTTSKNVTALGLTNVINTYSNNVKLIKNSHYVSSMRSMNPSQMYNLFRGPPNKIHDSFLSVLDSFLSSSLPNPVTKLQSEFIHYTINKELNSLVETYRLFGNEAVIQPRITKIRMFVDKIYNNIDKKLKQPIPAIKLSDDKNVVLSVDDTVIVEQSSIKDLHNVQLMLFDIYDKISPSLKDTMKDLIKADSNELLLSYSKYNTERHFNKIIHEDMKKYLKKIKVN